MSNKKDLISHLENIYALLNECGENADEFKKQARAFAKNIYGREIKYAINEIKQTGQINKSTQETLNRLLKEGPRLYTHKPLINFLRKSEIFNELVANNSDFRQTEKMNDYQRYYFDIFKNGMICEFSQEVKHEARINNSVLNDFIETLLPQAPSPTLAPDGRRERTAGSSQPLADHTLHRNHQERIPA